MNNYECVERPALIINYKLYIVHYSLYLFASHSRLFTSPGITLPPA